MEDDPYDPSDAQAFNDDFGFVLGSQPEHNKHLSHLPADCTNYLWHKYVENVDPLTKIIHVPTLQPAVEEAASNPDHIPRAFEALLLAIFGAAIMSMSDEECRRVIGKPRAVSRKHYARVTEAALARARVLETTRLHALQALTIHLFAVQDLYKPRTLWSITGVAIRIAQAMGLERDGSHLGLPYFDAEMRRRIWWALKTFDHRVADLCGLSKFRDLNIDSHSTNWPANVNDDQLHPGMTEPPASVKMLTDAAFIALKYEFVGLAAARVSELRKQGKEPSQWDLDLSTGAEKGSMIDSLKEMEEVLETKYLRYCDPSEPLHLMTILMARSAMNTVTFLANHPRRWTSLERMPIAERQLVWKLSIKLLEQYSILQSNALLKQFAWYAPLVMQWHTFIHVLDTLRAEPLILGGDRAWDLIGTMYENNPAMTLSPQTSIHAGVGSLCLKAYDARVLAHLRDGETHSPPAPAFISKLRHRQRAAKAKRQARSKCRCDVEDGTRSNFRSGFDGDIRSDTNACSPTHTPLHTPFQQTTISNLSRAAREGINVADQDSFWKASGFDDDQHGDLNVTLNGDVDLNIDHLWSDEIENSHIDACPTEPTISWEQWDAWLAESGTMLFS